MQPAEAEAVKAFEETMLTKILQVKANSTDLDNNLFNKAIASDLSVIMETIIQKKRSMGLYNVDVNLRLQKIDQALRDLGGEGLRTKQPFAFQFIKKFDKQQAPSKGSEGRLSQIQNQSGLLGSNAAVSDKDDTKS